ncbi:cadherin-15-like isoform X2 [Terrapene carolina triunguis]|uniref:cadherin-15-like isoform X2 n=1 Tax=Terrapene triunguis TaxID=2587831 RepID=UPI0011565408|nr:cadherin-15-like isoform X2 [Terrapene carolina triunguis]
MESPCLLAFCLLAPLWAQIWTGYRACLCTPDVFVTQSFDALTGVAKDINLSQGEAGLPASPLVLYPWRQRAGPSRVKRAWVIPPISVSENHKRIPHLLVQIKSDKQLPGGVIYSIKGPGVDEEPLGIFSIDKLSGKVFLNTMLDREKNDRFRLRAFALDLGGATLEDPTDLEIVVVDQNDNRPLFQQEVFTGHVVEGAVPGTYVLKAEATDADDPDTDNAALRYSILEQGSAGLFSINETTGEIRTVQVGLDREVVSVYNLTLQVADMSGDGLATTATAVIYVDDINDNPPEFTKPEFSVEVLENTSGVDIGRLLVHDKDLPGSPNWLARFTILEGDPDGAFAIRTDPRTNDGVLSVVKALDHEGRDHFTLTVSVQNQNQLHPSAPQTTRALAMVQVQVQDVNEAPFFPKNPRLARVAEGAPPGTELITFSASDPDTRQPQALSYSLAYDPADWLLLDPRSGMVQTKRELPRRSPFLQGSWYTAVILASDKADPPSTATGTLSIEIVEVNDHGPALLPLAGVMCSEPSKGRGLLLSAMDEDLPPHAEPFHFRLSPDAPQLAHNWSLSQLNATHAVLAVLVPVPAGLHSLPLLLSDSGTPRQERAQLLNVSVCPCDEGGSCQASAAAASTAGAGLSFGALMIILSSVILLLSLALLAAVRERCHRRPRHEGLLGSSQDDLRDNILNYDEQGGGEEDQGAYNINQLRNPDFFPLPCPPGKQPIRRDTPYSYATPPYPRKLPASPSDIEDFINEGLEAADSDPNIPPYDTALIYDCEGSGSVAGSLSSIVSSLTDGDQDYDYLSEWGPRFRRLADLYGH